ncbi:hypothetical protein [Bacillus subtilis]|uniref:hypothetical protein n=1 Tax=Bacillus subtilis TaxID=1423 RepID=UPI003F83A867
MGNYTVKYTKDEDGSLITKELRLSLGDKEDVRVHAEREVNNNEGKALLAIFEDEFIYEYINGSKTKVYI